MTTLPLKWDHQYPPPHVQRWWWKNWGVKELLGRQTLAITIPAQCVGIKSDPSTAPIFSTTYSKSDKMDENVSHEQLKQSIQLETNTNKITHAHTYARTGAHRPIDDDFDFNSNTYDYAKQLNARVGRDIAYVNDSDSDSDSESEEGATELGLTAATGSDSDSDSDSDNGNVGIGTTSPEPETSSQPELLDISNLANDELGATYNFGQMYGFEKRRFYVFNIPLNYIPYNKCMRPFAQDCPYPHTHTHTHGRPLLLDERDKLGEWYGRQPRKHTLILRYWTRRRGRRGQRFHAPSFAPLRIAGQCAHGSSCP